MRRILGVCAWLAVACCSSSTAAVTTASPTPNRSPTAAAIAVAGGCATTQVYKGGEPEWLTKAGAGNNPEDVPYFITSPPIAAGFVFGYPLTAGVTQNGANKILWVVGVPRDGANLDITGYPVSTGTPVVHMTRTPDSGPGEIYPTLMDVPSAGCWHFGLRWGPNTASADLVYT